MARGTAIVTTSQRCPAPCRHATARPVIFVGRD